MTDALCGPSNALSNFQKHSGVDRKLQQDRLGPQRSHDQGFRSAPGPNAGVLDAEFEAFQAGQLPQFHEGHQQHTFNNTFPQHGPSKSFEPPPQLSGWASDFQNLNMNDAQHAPVPASHFRQFAPPQPSAAAGWHQDFIQQTAQTAQPAASQQRFQPEYLNRSFVNPPLNQGLYNMAPALEEQVAHTQQEQGSSQDIDDALFEKHFEQAALEMDQAMGRAEADLRSMNGATSEKTQHEQDNMTIPFEFQDRAPAPTESSIDAGLHDRIGSDRILEEHQEKGKERELPDDGDELARTAGSLLENVKDDHSQKFKQSNFLSLMRQLRDREVRVEGDKLIDTTQPLHPGGQYYPGDRRETETLQHSNPA